MLSAVLCARCTMRMALVGAHILFYRSVRESGRYDSGRRAVHGTVNCRVCGATPTDVRLSQQAALRSSVCGPGRIASASPGEHDE